MKHKASIAIPAVLLAACGSLSPVEAGASAHKEACTSARAWVEGVERRSDGFSVRILSDIKGASARAIVDHLNSVPPVTHLAADHIVVLGAHLLANGSPVPYVLIALFSRDCLVTAGRADPTQATRLLSDDSI